MMQGRTRSCELFCFSGFLLILTLSVTTAANHRGLSAVTVKDQSYDSTSRYSYYFEVKIKSWITNSKQGLFINGEFKADSNSSEFLVSTSGVYYVTANIIVAVGSKYSQASWRYNFISGEIHLEDESGSRVRSTMDVSSNIDLKSSSIQQVNVKISAYILLESGWRASILITSSRKYVTIKTGSTFSLLYTSKPFAFPGIQIRGNYQYLELKSPGFSKNLNEWQNPEDSSSMSWMSKGNFAVPLNGLYHVVANINIQRNTDVEFRFAIVVNNTAEVLSKTTSLVSEGTITITLEGLLNLIKHQTISISISSNNKMNASLSTYSTVFICYKGEISDSHPGLSATVSENNKRLPANTWNMLKQWNVNTKLFLHFGNNEFQNSFDQFVISKSGFYYVVLVISISDCNQAVAKLNLKQSLSHTVNAVGTGFYFVAENKTCRLDVSLILQMNINDTLQVYVKSDKAFTVQPMTTFQILHDNDLVFWSAARFTITTSFPFSTNKPLTKVTGWSPTTPKIGYHVFFTIREDNIEIRVPGLYIVSCSIVLKSASKLAGYFESQLTVNEKATITGIKCRRNNIPQSFTCVMSTLLNLYEKDSLAFLVKTNDSRSKQESTLAVLPSSSVSVILVGDTRSLPSFRLVVQPRHNPYITKAKTITTSKYSGFQTSNTINTFVQNNGLYSHIYKSFKTGSKNAFFIQSSMQFKLFNDGQVSSVVGSWKRNTHAYSSDHTKGLTSVLASSIIFDDNYNVNISGKAFDSDFKWEIEPSSIVSGLYIGNSESLTTFEARLSPSSTNCSSEWKRVVEWKDLLGTSTDSEGFKVSQEGLFFVILNIVMATNIPGKTVDVGVFYDNKNVLFASETTPKSGSVFNILLEGLVTLNADQIMDVKIKCSTSFGITFSKQTSISGFQVDKDPTIPGLHWRLKPSSQRYTHSSSRKFIPYYYNHNQRNNEYYATHTKYKQSTYTTSVSRSGIYFVSLTGELNNNERSDFIFSTNASDASCLYENPIFFKKTNNFVRSVSASGLVFLRKDANFALVDLPGRQSNSYWSNHYHYYYDRYSHVYLSLHYIGDLEISNGFSSTLRSSMHLQKGSNLMDTEWLAHSTCGRFSTADVPTEFQNYKASYSGTRMFSVSLMLLSQEKCHVSVCFVINDRSHRDDHQSCFEHHIMNDTTSTETTSTVGGSILLSLEEGQRVSIQVNNTCALTISNRSSLSVVDFGRNALFGFSSTIATAKATLRAVLLEKNLYGYRHYYGTDYEDATTAYDVQGWITNDSNSMMVFKRGISSQLNEMFVCSKTGIYLILVKLHVKAVGKVLKQSNGCVVSSKLAVDSTDMNVGVQQLFSGATNTLSFSTTMMLRKWQALTVRFINIHEQCGEMEISQGSTFAAIYMAGAVESYIMPSIGPHIVKIPPRNVLIRTDKVTLSKLTCKAVGVHTIKYQWIKDDKEVISDSGILDVKKLNSDDTSVTCVVTMGTIISRSTTISIAFFDPTPKFIETYSNMTYFVQERNATQTGRYVTIVTLGLRESVPRRSYYYWFDINRIECSILNDHNDTFHIFRTYNYYRYSRTQLYELYIRDELTDREKREEYNVTISCANTNYKDAGNVTTTLHVVILDVNDNLPVFQQPIYNTTIPRNLRPGEDIIQVLATDDDDAQNGDIAYKLIHTSDSYIFMIDPSSGVISLSSYGLIPKPLYILTVEATDHGKPPLSSYVMVVLVVRGFIYNRTNHHPVFEKPEYTAYLIQLAPIGSVVQVVRAYDPDTLDEKSIVYSIYSGDPDKTFKIDSKTGLITTKGKLSAKTYRLQIAAEYLEKQPHKEDMNITEVIIKVHDVTKPTFLQTNYKKTIKEDAAIGTSVVTVKAVGENLPSQYFMNYSIPGPQEAFVIDSRSGQISVAAKLDYETTKRYVFVVSASEVPDTSQSTCTDVTIDIKDVNDNTPIIVSAPKEIRLNEYTPKGTLIGNVTAIDLDQGDNGKIKYYLEDIVSDFRIDPNNGEIFTKELLDCCDVVYRLRVEVKDEGTPPRSTSIVIDVFLQGSTPTTPTRGLYHYHAGNKMTIIIVSSCAGVLILIFIVVIIYCKRRRRRGNFAASMNYMDLPTDEEDAELLDPTGSDENERRLSLISGTSDYSAAGSQENLLRSEVQC